MKTNKKDEKNLVSCSKEELIKEAKLLLKKKLNLSENEIVTKELSENENTKRTK